MPAIDRRLSVAPMLNWTDRHCRYFHRLLAPHALLYTEMVTTGALLYGDVARHLDFSPAELPVALQLGGCEPRALAQCAKLGADYGYSEINLNVGCPSARVQSGSFGACLIKSPALVGECIAAMRQAVNIPISVKTRIGVDEIDSDNEFIDFCQVLVEAGASAIIVHARKAWLQGLSPKQNREIPPLNYARVALLKQYLRANNLKIPVILNGGLQQVPSAVAQLANFDGIMLGRQAYAEPYILAELEHAIFGTPLPAREQIVEQLLAYIDAHLQAGGELKHISRHILGLFNQCAGAKNWRRILSEHAYKAGSNGDLVKQALSQIQRRGGSHD